MCIQKERERERGREGEGERERERERETERERERARYIYIYGNPPHELPTLVLYRKYRVKNNFSGRSGFCISQKLPKTNPDFKRTCQSTHSRST